MAINKVIFDNNTLIDITDTTATADDVAEGKEFYLANGVKAIGTSTGGNIDKVEIDFTVQETEDGYIYEYNLTNDSINLLSQKVINDDLDFEIILNPLTDFEEYDKKIIEPFEIKKRITTWDNDGKNYKDLYMQIFYDYQNPHIGMLNSRELEYTFTYNISDMIYPDIDEQYDFELSTDTNWVHQIANTKFATEFTDRTSAMSVATKTASQYNSLNDGAFIGKGTLNNVLNDRFSSLKISKLTQAQYNALSTKDSNTMYVIVG